jgi:L-threonylcarbamoyladenylate synthase
VGPKPLKIWRVRNSNERNLDQLKAMLKEPAEILKNGGLIAFPTETVYGLGANALDEQAVKRIFEAKGRPSDNPLIVHIADASQLHLVVPDGYSPPQLLRQALETFWPGPLTVIVPAREELAPSVHPGLSTVGVRCPAHPVASALLAAAGCPVAAPSANRSGRPSPTNAEDVLEDMKGRIDGVVDGGSCAVGLESTVVHIDERRVVIYRPGGITKEQLEDALGVPVEYDAHIHSPSEMPKSPGMKYRHYAPDALVRGWWGDFDHVAQQMRQFVETHPGEKIAIISPEPLGLTDLEWVPQNPDAYAVELSRELYRLLRAFDRQGAAHVLVCGVEPEGVGSALMNRLGKATEGRLEKV